MKNNPGHYLFCKLIGHASVVEHLLQVFSTIVKKKQKTIFTGWTTNWWGKNPVDLHRKRDSNKEQSMKDLGQ